MCGPCILYLCTPRIGFLARLSRPSQVVPGVAFPYNASSRTMLACSRANEPVPNLSCNGWQFSGDLPHMSNESKVVSVVGSAGGSSRVDGVPAAIFVPTDRRIDGDKECWSQVQMWAQLEDHEMIVSHPLTQRLREVLKSAQPSRGKEGRSLGVGSLISAYFPLVHAKWDLPLRTRTVGFPVGVITTRPSRSSISATRKRGLIERWSSMVTTTFGSKSSRLNLMNFVSPIFVLPLRLC